MTATDYEYEDRLKHTHRNDPCPCGSGKKYKKCHMPEDEAAQHAAMRQAAEQNQDVVAQNDTEKAKTTASRPESTFIPGRREAKTHLKGQQSKGSRSITLPRRIGKA